MEFKTIFLRCFGWNYFFCISSSNVRFIYRLKTFFVNFIQWWMCTRSVPKRPDLPSFLHARMSEPPLQGMSGNSNFSRTPSMQQLPTECLGSRAACVYLFKEYFVRLSDQPIYIKFFFKLPNEICRNYWNGSEGLWGRLYGQNTN